MTRQFGKGLIRLALVAAALATSSCGFFYTNVEVARVTSPDGAIDAVVRETNGGATTSFGYVVSLTGAGKRHGSKSVASFYGATRSATAYGVNLNWLNANDLEIQYFQSRVAALEHSSVRINERTIQVSLKSGVEDMTAPAGGMEYNLLDEARRGD